MPTFRCRLVLVLGTALLWATACGPGEGPSNPTPSLPSDAAGTAHLARTGPPTILPWWSHGRLHVEGRVLRTTLRRIVAQGGTTLVGRTDAQGSTWRVVRGDGLVPLVATRESGVTPVVSANGRHAAWTTSRTLRHLGPSTTEEAFTVTAYDVARGRRSGTTVLESRVTCCDQSGVIGLLADDDDGTVILERDDRRTWAWRPGSRPAALRGPVGGLVAPAGDQWPGGVTWLVTGDGAGPAAFGRVDRAGVVTSVGRLPQGVLGLWSPDGTSYAYRPLGTIGPLPPVVWSKGGHVGMRAPAGTEIVGWESVRSLVVLVHHHPTVLLRCDVRTGGCAQAGPPLGRVVLPEYAG